jgi:tetratricopeptide (TPR) repeat protein
MTMTSVEEQPAVEAPAPDYAEAARLLEQAMKVGCQDTRVAYMLAICYKRLGRTVEARTQLRKIAQPDANVYLQLGLLSFAERVHAQAAQEFAQAWQMDPSLYEAAYDLMLARLCLGEMAACAALVPQIVALAPTAKEQHFLGLLEALLRTLPQVAGASTQANGEKEREAVLSSMTAEDEQRLLGMLAGLGRFDAAYPLLRRLANARPNSPAAQEAYLEAVLVQGKQLMDRGEWDEAKELLAPLARLAAQGSGKAAPRHTHIALLNLLGCCACMQQDFDQGVWYFNTALTKVGDDAWLHQNLALAYEWQGRLDHADTHWNRYFDLLDRRTPAPPIHAYQETLAFEGLSRLAESYSKREKWTNALSYLQRAQRLRPQDADLLERLFHLYNQMKRPDDARKTLRRLRDVRPNDPQFDLYELDIRDVRTVDDIERMLADIRRTVGRHPNDMRVEERAAAMVGNVVPVMTRIGNQLTDQVNKIVDQMRRLPSYQINWPAVREVMRDLQEEFMRLRRAANKCLGLVSGEDHRRTVRELIAHIDRKVELCHSMGG